MKKYLILLLFPSFLISCTNSDEMNDGKLYQIIGEEFFARTRKVLISNCLDFKNECRKADYANGPKYHYLDDAVLWDHSYVDTLYTAE